LVIFSHQRFIEIFVVPEEVTWQNSVGNITD
jgi:hypothetical protein